MTKYFYAAITLNILLLLGCADAGKNETVQANTKVYLDTSHTHTDMGGKITQYNWTVLGDFASSVHIFNNGSANASFMAPDVSKKTTLRIQLTTVESYKCKTRLDSSCKHHRSTDTIKFTVEPHKRDDSNTTTNSHKNTITLSGKIMSATHTAIAGATITVNTQSVSSGNDGSYRFSNLATPERTILRVSHADYFDNSRVIIVKQKGDYTQDIALNKAQSNKSFQAKEGTSLTSNQASVTIEKGKYTTENKKKYTGTLFASLVYNPLKTAQEKQAFVGSYEKTDGTNSFPIVPYAIMQITISDTEGKTITPARSNTIKIAFPQHDTKSTEASLSLWFYDTQLAYWIKKGTSILENTHYIAEVHQVGTWGLFKENPKASIEVCVNDAQGVALTGAAITITTAQWQANRIQTNDQGHALVQNVLATIPLTIQASKKIANTLEKKTYPKHITLLADENKFLSDCIVLGKKVQTPKEDNASKESNGTSRP